MAGPLDWLAVGGGTPAERLVLSTALVVVLVATAFLARAVRRRLDLDGYVARAANVAFALVLLAVAAGVAGALLEMWGDEPAVETALASIAVENPAVVLTQVLLTAAILVGAYLLTGLAERFVHDVTSEGGSITRHQRELVYRSTQVTVYVLALVVTLGVWRVELGGLLVGAGFLGIVVGLAARQTLGSLLAGFVLMFARPFEIGDWIQIGEREGIVTEISIVNTRIQTFDGEYAMIPNDTVGSSEVINRTRKGRLRIEVGVGVDYETDVEEAMEVAVEAMQSVDDVLSVPQPRVVAKGFGASSIDLALRFWIDKPSARRKWRAQTAVVTAVKEAFDREGIEIPFPQRTLSDRAGAGGEGFDVDGPPMASSEPDGGPDDG